MTGRAPRQSTKRGKTRRDAVADGDVSFRSKVTSQSYGRGQNVWTGKHWNKSISRKEVVPPRANPGPPEPTLVERLLDGFESLEKSQLERILDGDDEPRPGVSLRKARRRVMEATRRVAMNRKTLDGYVQVPMSDMMDLQAALVILREAETTERERRAKKAR